MIPLVAAVYGAFGVLSCVGGAIGFKKAGSRASLIAGSVAGAALVGASFLVFTGSTNLGLALGGGTSLLLGGRFLPSYLKTKKLMPQGMMAGFSILGSLLTVAAFLR